MVNNQGKSVGKDVVLPYPINVNTPDQIDVVYPNALTDMRNQVIDVVGQESNMLPLWMLSTQADGTVLGFTPAWVIAYTLPGKSGQIQYNIETQYGTQLNLVPFEADRYELDRALTANYDPATHSWIPNPPLLTTFDRNYHYDISLAEPGQGYRVGDRLTIQGVTLGGTTPNNNLTIEINTVTSSGMVNGIIEDIFYSGTASIIAAGRTYTAVPAAGGTGVGAKFTVRIVPGVETVFDGNSVEFVDPSTIATDSQAADRYILYPKYDIIDSLPQEN